MGGRIRHAVGLGAARPALLVLDIDPQIRVLPSLASKMMMTPSIMSQWFPSVIVTEVTL